MKKKYFSPEIIIYATEITHALMDVSGNVENGGGLDNQGGAGGEAVACGNSLPAEKIQAGADALQSIRHQCRRH